MERDLPFTFALQVQPNVGETLGQERSTEEGCLLWGCRMRFSGSNLLQPHLSPASAVVPTTFPPSLWRSVPGLGGQGWEGGGGAGRGCSSPKEPRLPWYQCQGDLAYQGASLRTLRQG